MSLGRNSHLKVERPRIRSLDEQTILRGMLSDGIEKEKLL